MDADENSVEERIVVQRRGGLLFARVAAFVEDVQLALLERMVALQHRRAAVEGRFSRFEIFRADEGGQGLEGRQDLNIAVIAKRAGISRPTIYNNPDLHQMCLQAIEAQRETNLVEQAASASTAEEIVTKSPLEVALEKIESLKVKNKKLLLENARLQTEVTELKKILYTDAKVRPLPNTINPMKS